MILSNSVCSFVFKGKIRLQVQSELFVPFELLRRSFFPMVNFGFDEKVTPDQDVMTMLYPTWICLFLYGFLRCKNYDLV